MIILYNVVIIYLLISNARIRNEICCLITDTISRSIFSFLPKINFYAKVLHTNGTFRNFQSVNNYHSQHFFLLINTKKSSFLK
jgi:hypothetical protein